MKLGIIGFSGYVRRAYIPYLKARPDIELRAVCDIIEPGDLSRLIATEGLDSSPTLFCDLHSMLAMGNLDAMIVSTPHVFHFEQVRTCLEAGLHVIVDKPLACRVKEAKTLVKLAESKGLQLAVANNRRYERPYQYIKQAMQQQRLGEIRLVSYLFANSPWYDYRQSWRGDPLLSGGGALIDIGHLAVDMTAWLLEKPLRWIQAHALTPDDKQVEQSAAILAEFKPHVLANLSITYECPVPSVQEELSIYGSLGSMFTRRFRTQRSSEPPLLIEQFKNGEIRQVSFTQGPDSSRPLDDFLQGIETGNPILSDGKSNLPTVELIDAAYRSIRGQQKITLRN